jgi:60 kDa SS-A/Ro ribonucleoprotein
MQAYTSFSTKRTAQTEAIPFENQVKNNAGGFVYTLDIWGALERFLILGSEGGTFYVAEKKLTREAALRVIECIKADGKRTVDVIVEVSVSGRAPKNDPALFALALASAAVDKETRTYALDALPKVARIPTHLFHFVTFAKQFRGIGGRGFKRALASWYLGMRSDKLAYEVVKYQARDGWSNRDVLRQAHPKTNEVSKNGVFRWIVDGMEGLANKEAEQEALPSILQGFESAKTAKGAELTSLIRTYELTREMVPTESLKDPKVWEALLDKMPVTAMLRNLGNMSKCGLLTPLSNASKLVVSRLSDGVLLKQARLHPMSVLVALKQYGLGHGLKGDGKWTPVPAVLDGLDDAFYATFENLTPTGETLLIAIDLSGSMMGSNYPLYRGDYTKDIAGTCVHPCEGAAAMALACAKLEKDYFIMGFGGEHRWNMRQGDLNGFKALNITAKTTLRDATKIAHASTFGPTDCALPMIWAEKNKAVVGAFMTITDNETWCGEIHPKQALKSYRERFNPKAKNIVIGMTATNFTIADPTDSGSLDVVGFDAAAPSVISDFIRGGRA